MAVTKAAFDDFATRKEVFLKLVGEVQKFVADSEVRPWLDKLQISQTKDVWLEQKDFDAAVSSTEKQLTLLIAGTGTYVFFTVNQNQLHALSSVRYSSIYLYIFFFFFATGDND